MLRTRLRPSCACSLHGVLGDQSRPRAMLFRKRAVASPVSVTMPAQAQPLLGHGSASVYRALLTTSCLLCLQSERTRMVSLAALALSSSATRVRELRVHTLCGSG